jgi:hypothetical protein
MAREFVKNKPKLMPKSDQLMMIISALDYSCAYQNP